MKRLHACCKKVGSCNGNLVCVLPFLRLHICISIAILLLHRVSCSFEEIRCRQACSPIASQLNRAFYNKIGGIKLEVVGSVCYWLIIRSKAAWELETREEQEEALPSYNSIPTIQDQTTTSIPYYWAAHAINQNSISRCD
jgi:hypothetical protein